VNRLAERLTDAGFTVQTKRVCSPGTGFKELEEKVADDSIITLPPVTEDIKLEDFFAARNVSFNLDLTGTEITKIHVDLLFKVIYQAPEKTFNFTYTFNTPPSCPYFPSATYGTDGFAVGLQPTDLSEGCGTLDQWLGKMKEVWLELHAMFKNEKDFLGIDSSVAPLFEGSGSLVRFIKSLGMSFDRSVTTDTYLNISNFIKTQNPQPVGLCGLMFPCLEDFELAQEYEAGNFSIERCIFLSLHSGLGIDTYPVGIDEDPGKIIQILKVLQGFSGKYRKPLSARFVSDGRARTGQKTDFAVQYLKNVTVLPL
jgi:hypothetical protein